MTSETSEIAAAASAGVLGLVAIEPQCRSSVAASAVYTESRTGAGGTDGRTVDGLKCFNKCFNIVTLVTFITIL